LSATLPAYAQQRGISTSQPSHSQSKSSLFHRVHVPAAGELPLLRAAQTKFTNYDGGGDNWSGYTVGSGSGNGFKGVEAKWNAPCTSGTRDYDHQYASWVGLGGYFPFSNPEPLEQAGIYLQTDGTYRLFWEYAPYNNPAVDPAVIYCGDHILAWVYFGYSYCSNGGFYAHVEDDTTGHTAHWGSTCLTESHGLGHQSSDWIDERPTINCGRPSQLADFNYTQWSNVLAQANYSGAAWVNPNSFVNTQVLMWDNGNAYFIAFPDGLHVNSDNTFTDRWYHYGTLCDV